ncbi:MAG: hypothetical protein ACLS6E_02330 [Lachnospiraceae bacterium]
MATSIDDNAADENLYKLFGEMSVIQYTRLHGRVIAEAQACIRRTVSIQ